MRPCMKCAPSEGTPRFRFTSTLGVRITSELRSGNATEAICATIRTAGEKLSAVLPRETDDVNELPDALVTID